MRRVGRTQLAVVFFSLVGRVCRLALGSFAFWPPSLGFRLACLGLYLFFVSDFFLVIDVWFSSLGGGRKGSSGLCSSLLSPGSAPLASVVLRAMVDEEGR